MNIDEEKNIGLVNQQKHPPPPPQGVPNYPPPYPPAQPIPPPGFSGPPPVIPGYVVAQGTTFEEPRLPCCGIGVGWFLFILGFFLGVIPWYIGFLMLLCGRNMDYREKPGFIACTVGAIVSAIIITIGATKGANVW
ncbi:hypothetical protein ACFE04_011337 [Oxalis oulophora]